MTTDIVNLCDNGAHLPFGETGSGNYGMNLGSLDGKYTILLRTDEFLKLSKMVPFPNKASVYNIGDYGTADGAASMRLLGKLIESLREHHGHDVQFQVIYEDQEINDFNSLFRRLSGLIPKPPSYLQDLENVFALASGTHFYKQCVPADSMHIILCMAAVHWLSGKPPVNKDFIYCFPETEADVRQSFEKQASEDWEKFLTIRSRELKKGGLLVVSAPSDNPTSTGGMKLCNENYLHMLNSTWKEFCDNGRISKSEFVNTNLACFHKGLSLLKAPFENTSSNVSRSGLRLLSADVVTLPCEVYNEWKQRKEDEGVDDRAGYARRFVSAHRCWSNSAFLAGLSGTRSKEEKEVIVSELYGRVESIVGKMNPELLKDDYTFSFVFITKD
ncbi:farnesoic acid carboxyl-O-methyltransferase-like [Haliotis rufescens]|uniref:farnesoic acid carboxyl-O-methyltransferase-like n=1 Tax=Haliotis rufescens TaxID=6454 RepID=UPI001EB0189B|nr:farnesoic acid carboxyl-O-methyltransferase-like [Haliotis rufescens]